jgi:hypothetical protein
MKHPFDLAVRAAVPIVAATLFSASGASAAEKYFEIQVQDAATGRGVPLVELLTVNKMRYVTDSAGRVAFREPGLMGQTVFFDIQAHGYEAQKDGFGIAGTRLKVEEGGSAVVKLKRQNIAERLYRCTGYGIYRDSVLLGKDAPIADPLDAGMVAGQDSVLATPYRGKLYWFWGDTGRMSYPLGLFRMAGATSELPARGGLAPSVGVNLKYFTAKDGFCRAMADVPNPEGVVWIDGVCIVPDENGRERLVSHFSRRKGLEGEFEHGMMLYNDEREIFEVKTTLPLNERWRHLAGQPTKVKVEGKDYIYSGGPVLNVRVPATLADVMDPAKYESFSCVAPDADPAKADPKREWTWKNSTPVSSKDEIRWLKDGKIKGSEARFSPEDAGKPGRRVHLHSGSVRWNPHRQRWILIAVEFAYHEKDSPSPLGEVWYSEAASPEGPFSKAVRIVTHNKQTFYNPVHHSFFDEENGRVIYFEGTYTNSFVGTPPTPLYEYNQVMYRLDLDAPKLREVFAR